MAINFDAIPQESPFAVPPADLYEAEILAADMKKAKAKTDASGNTVPRPDYLNIRFGLTDMAGNSKGSMFDIIAESDSQVVMYKIGRFVRACGIPLQGSVELKDLAKIIKGKKLLIETMVDDSNPKYVKAQVDLFSHEGYWKLSEKAEVLQALKKENAPLVGTGDNSFVNDIPAEDTVFNAPEQPAPTDATLPLPDENTGSPVEY